MAGQLSFVFLVGIVLLFGTGKSDLIELSHDPNDVHFYLYPTPGDTQFNQEIKFDDLQSLDNSLFQAHFKTVFIIHGFRSNMSSEMPQTVKDAYLISGQNSNYIVVDWGKLSIPLPPPLTSALYALVVQNVPIVARRVADFVAFLKNNDKVEPSQIHLIGHSLGSHISGLVGKYTQETFNGLQIARITGLDPAGPLYFPPVACRNLVKEDAAFVDVIHSNMGVLGDTTEDGHADFYPNGGITQPGCELEDTGIPSGDAATIGRCSHRFSYKILIASLNKVFIACQCDPFLNVVLLQLCFGRCEIKATAGEPCDPKTRGKFYFKTSSTP